MRPEEIGDVFDKGHLTKDEAMIHFVRCAEHQRVNEIVLCVPKSLRTDFRDFIMQCPDQDIPTIGWGDVHLKKEWIQAFKSFYQQLDADRLAGPRENT